MNKKYDKTIFWDFDGTLGYRKTGWSGSILRTLNEEVKNHKFNIDDIRPYTREGFFWDDYENAHTHIDSGEKWWTETRKIFIKAFLGLGFQESHAIDLAFKAQKVFLDYNEFTLYDDTISVLKHFKDIGYTNMLVFLK